MKLIIGLLFLLALQADAQIERRRAQQAQGTNVPAGSDLLDGITLHAKLDDGSGTTAADSSGNGHDGTLSGTAAFGVGYVDMGDGGSGKVDFGALTFLDGGSSFSISLWFKFDDFTTSGGFQFIASKFNNGAGAGPFYILWFEASAAIFFQTDTSSGSVSSFKGSLTGDTTTYHHVVATYDGANQRIYFDGALADTDAQTGGLDTATNREIILGQSDDAAGQFDGRQKDFRIYAARVLSDADVAAIYAAGPNP